ncbi:hypothetical protein C4J81_17975 [Deltaproteobacteria bacterium Smac51]|nr:hypothetical protein C4J81_17975 [Deltaproteobacteria bacterium Smac51]
MCHYVSNSSPRNCLTSTPPASASGIPNGAIPQCCHQVTNTAHFVAANANYLRQAVKKGDSFSKD